VRHLVAQAPQWVASLFRSTQDPLQSVSGAVHPLLVHTPRLQTSPVAHAVPHPPQFFGSVPVSTHVPSGQRVSPAFGQRPVPPSPPLSFVSVEIASLLSVPPPSLVSVTDESVGVSGVVSSDPQAVTKRDEPRSRQARA